MEKCTATHYAWITEEDGISLGDDAADPNAVTFLCGLYDLDGDIDEGNSPTLVGAEASSTGATRPCSAPAERASTATTGAATASTAAHCCNRPSVVTRLGSLLTFW
jgi:hypothetical protein